MTTFVLVHSPLVGPGQPRFADLHPAFQGRLLAMARDGVLPPWHEWWHARLHDVLPNPNVRDAVVAELEPLPLALFEEPLPDVADWPDQPCAYLRLSDTYATEEAAAAGRSWPVTRLPSTHLELLVRPAAVADSMLTLLGRLGL